jgi:tetratricopeptide (TPR) repeat protein
MKKSFSIAILLSISLLTSSVSAYLRCTMPGPNSTAEESKKIARRYYVMGMSFQRDGDLLNFIDAFRCVLKIIPYSLSARYKLAEAYDTAGQYTKAIREYKSVLSSSQDKTLNKKITKRIAKIKNLADKPMPVDPDSNYSPKNLNPIDAKEIARLKKKHEEALATLKKTRQENDNYEKQRIALLESFKQQLKKIEKSSGKNKVIVKYVKEAPKYKTVPSKLRKWGMGITALGVLSGIASLVSFQLRNYTIDQLDAYYTDSNKPFKELQSTPPGLSYANFHPNLWDSGVGPGLEEDIPTYTMLTVGFGIAAGVFVIGGTFLYFIGGTKRVKIDNFIESEPEDNKKGSWKIAPTFTNQGAGIAFEAKW